MEKLAGILWGTPMMVLFLVVGVVLTWKTGFVQVRKFSQALRQVAESMCSRDRSAFRSVCTALAATVGTGNIAGVAGAIALGGPGAVFWMWIAAFLGMATKYAEVVLAMDFRTKDGRGGPMYYITKGMGVRFSWLGRLFAFSAVLASFGMGNIAQANTIASSVMVLFPQADPRWTALLTGLAAALVVAVVILGGKQRVGQVTEKLVPWMAGVYLVAMVSVLVVYRQNLIDVFSRILQGAFRPEAVLGGGVGIGMKQAIRLGLSRGVFSNEAGLGSAPMAHAASSLPPHRQGLLGIFEVFFDTIVLCSLTAFAILSSGVAIPYGTAAGAELATGAVQTVFGSGAPGLMAAVLCLLALATIISWQLYGVQCAEFLWGKAAGKGYRVCYVAAVVLGATMNLSGAWAVSDVCNGLMCLPNLTALLCLRNNLKNQSVRA